MTRPRFRELAVWLRWKAFGTKQDAQKARPARPQGSRNRRRTLWGYVEDFDDPRTLLAGFFSILLAVRWARVHPRSDGHLNPRNALHIGAQIAQAGGD